jgi:hypothetical protein
MTTRKQAAYPKGGIVLQPAVSQEEGSDLLGVPITDEAWGRIALAFALFGDGMDALDTPRPNDAKNDPQSWHQQQRASVADLNRAFECIDRVTRDRIQFLMGALDNYSLQTHGHSGSLQMIRDLDDMKLRLIRAMALIERAEPFVIEVPTEATLRANLIAAIFRAMKEAGLPVTLSSKDAPGGLTRFESFLVKLGIDQGQSERAFAMKVRRAVTGLGDGAP